MGFGGLREMKIFWVEDFNILHNSLLDSNRIISETKYFLEPLLNHDDWSTEKTSILLEGDFDILDFIARLSNNKNPILWPGDLPSALACIEYGTKAYLNDNEFREISDIDFPFDFAIIDFYIPTSFDEHRFAKLTPEAVTYALDQYKYFKYDDNKEEFINSPLKEFLQEKQVNCAGVLVALKLLEKGFPLSRIKFLTGNAKDLNRYDLSLGIFGKYFEDTVVNKEPKEIDLLRKYILNDEYYNQRSLIRKSASIILSLTDRSSEKISLFRKRHSESKLCDLIEVQNKFRLINDIYNPLFPEEVLLKENKSSEISYNAQKYNAFLRIVLIDFSNNNFDEKNKPDKKIIFLEKKYDLLRIVRNISYHSELLSNLDNETFSIIYALYYSLICDLFEIESNNALNLFIEHFSTITGKNLSDRELFLSEDEFNILDYKLSDLKEEIESIFENNYSGFYRLFNNDLEKLDLKSPLKTICVLFWSRILGDLKHIDRKYISSFCSSKLTNLLFYVIFTETMKL